jgi:uncharacterized protein (DUF1501 family)
MVTKAQETARKLTETRAEHRRRHPEENDSEAAAEMSRERSGVTPADISQMQDVATRLTNSTQRLDYRSAAAAMKGAVNNFDTHTKDVEQMITIMDHMVTSLATLPKISGRVDSVLTRVKALEANPTTRTLPGE